MLCSHGSYPAENRVVRQPARQHSEAAYVNTCTAGHAHNLIISIFVSLWHAGAHAIDVEAGLERGKLESGNGLGDGLKL